MVVFFSHPYIPAMNQEYELPTYFRQTESVPAWITSKLSPLTFLHGRKQMKSSLLPLLCCILLWGPPSLSHPGLSLKCSSGQFSAIWQSQPPPKATTVGTNEDDGWWLKQIFACGRCVRDASISACHQPLCSLPFALCNLFCGGDWHRLVCLCRMGTSAARWI